MVFVPLAGPAARALHAGQALEEVRAFAVTPALQHWLGNDTSDEEADFAALSAAGTAALDRVRGDRRLVLAADVPAEQVSDLQTDLGEVRVRDFSWASVRALFADEDAAAGLVAAAAQVAAGLPLEQAWGLDAVVRLSESHDLLWYAPEELDSLT